MKQQTTKDSKYKGHPEIKEQSVEKEEDKDNEEEEEEEEDDDQINESLFQRYDQMFSQYNEFGAMFQETAHYIGLLIKKNMFLNRELEDRLEDHE